MNYRRTSHQVRDLLDLWSFHQFAVEIHPQHVLSSSGGESSFVESARRFRPGLEARVRVVFWRRNPEGGVALTQNQDLRFLPMSHTEGTSRTNERGVIQFEIPLINSFAQTSALTREMYATIELHLDGRVAAVQRIVNPAASHDGSELETMPHTLDELVTSGIAGLSATEVPGDFGTTTVFAPPSPGDLLPVLSRLTGRRVFQLDASSGVQLVAGTGHQILARAGAGPGIEVAVGPPPSEMPSLGSTDDAAEKARAELAQALDETKLAQLVNGADAPTEELLLGLCAYFTGLAAPSPNERRAWLDEVAVLQEPVGTNMVGRFFSPRNAEAQAAIHNRRRIEKFKRLVAEKSCFLDPAQVVRVRRFRLVDEVRQDADTQTISISHLSPDVIIRTATMNETGRMVGRSEIERDITSQIMHTFGLDPLGVIVPGLESSTRASRGSENSVVREVATRDLDRDRSELQMQTQIEVSHMTAEFVGTVRRCAVVEIDTRALVAMLSGPTPRTRHAPDLAPAAPLSTAANAFFLCASDRESEHLREDYYILRDKRDGKFPDWERQARGSVPWLLTVRGANNFRRVEKELADRVLEIRPTRAVPASVSHTHIVTDQLLERLVHETVFPGVL